MAHFSPKVGRKLFQNQSSPRYLDSLAEAINHRVKNSGSEEIFDSQVLERKRIPLSSINYQKLQQIGEPILIFKGIEIKNESQSFP